MSGPPNSGGLRATKGWLSIRDRAVSSSGTCLTVEPVSGRAIGWAETPQGETLVLVEAENGRLARWHDRAAGFQNLAAFAAAFPKDILTDFAFIEASFGISIAGVAG